MSVLGLDSPLVESLYTWLNSERRSRMDLSGAAARLWNLVGGLCEQWELPSRGSSRFVDAILSVEQD